MIYFDCNDVFKLTVRKFSLNCCKLIKVPDNLNINFYLNFDLKGIKFNHAIYTWLLNES